MSVGLPQDWLRYNKLGPGDEVEIVYDGEIRIRPRRNGDESENEAAMTETAARSNVVKHVDDPT